MNFYHNGNWHEGTLKSVCSAIKDGTHGTHKESKGSEIYLLSAKNINEGKIKFDNTDRRISLYEYNKITKTFKPKRGDILLTIVGTIGRSAIYNDEQNIAFQRSVAFLRPEKVISEYLYYYIQSPNFQTELIKKSVSSAQAGIYLGDLSKIIVRYPEISDQIKISDALSAVDSKIDLLIKKRDNLARFKAGLMQKIFSQEVRFTRENGSAYPDWEEKELGEIARVDWGDVNTTKSSYQDHGYTAYSAAGPDGLISKYDYDQPGIVISAIGSCGNTWLATGKWTAIKNTIVVFPHSDDVPFLYYATGDRNFWPQDGSTQKFISLKSARKCKVSIPSYEEQRRISEILMSIDKKITLLHAQIETIRNFKKGLLQQMFV